VALELDFALSDAAVEETDVQQESPQLLEEDVAVEAELEEMPQKDHKNLWSKTEMNHICQNCCQKVEQRLINLRLSYHFYF